MSGLDWEVIALGPTVAIVALAVVTAAARRGMGRRKRDQALTRSQLSERRIEVVALDDVNSSSNQDMKGDAG